ncbi:histidine phosphatase family protein [Paenibacillus sp. A14]|uniref:histidine phosphatase family protein n=1 Tax=Paenibacillus sp. A14 TaxID=3119820 RepID=UPI002FE194A6
MNTIIYMVRHGESPKAEGNERTRGLTEKGKTDAKRITELLKQEGIDIFFSSPYSRAIMTLEELARTAGKEMQLHEDLRELTFSSDDKIMSDGELYPLVSKMFSNRAALSPGGESAFGCQTRAVAVLKEILTKNRGQRIAIGTHGAVMTLIMEHFDSSYDFDFLMRTSKPDVYRMEFKDDELIEVERLWK